MSGTAITTSVAQALKSIFDWLTFWGKSSDKRNDKKTIKYAKELSLEIFEFDLDNNADNPKRLVDVIEGWQKLSKKVLRSLD